MDTPINEYLDGHRERLFEQWMDLTKIPGTSGQEQERAAFVRNCFAEAGLHNTHIDGKGNVVGTWPNLGSGPHIVVAPHMDTVFERDVPLEPTIKDGKVYAPGVRDNTAGTAAVLSAVQTLTALKLSFPAKITFVATVEEETGLKGMQYFLDHCTEPIDCLLAVDGPLGNISFGGPGVNWMQLCLSGQGGHAWQYHGRSSAVHAMAELVHTLTNTAIPRDPKTTLNVGTFQGGTVPNAIAERAETKIDLRSTCQSTLDQLTNTLHAMASEIAANHGLALDLQTINSLPAGALPGGADHPLIQAARDVLETLGQPINSIGYAATDANPGNARGIPSLAVGGTVGDRVHSIDEYAEIEPFYDGVRQILMLLERIPACIGG